MCALYPEIWVQKSDEFKLAGSYQSSVQIFVWLLKTDWEAYRGGMGWWPVSVSEILFTRFQLLIASDISIIYIILFLYNFITHLSSLLRVIKGPYKCFCHFSTNYLHFISVLLTLFQTSCNVLVLVQSVLMCFSKLQNFYLLGSIHLTALWK